MAIPVSASINPINAEVFIQEGYELSLDAIVPSIELTGSFSPTTSKTQFYIYNYAKTLLHENLDYNANGSYLSPESTNVISNSTSSYNQFELNPIEDIYNQGYSSGNYYALYNFIDYELGSEFNKIDDSEDYNGHPYFIKDISGDRTELRIQNNFLTQNQIETYYQQFSNKINARENADEFYISFSNNRNFIAVNSQLETPTSGSTTPTSILIKLYKPLPLDFEIEQQLQIISKVGETQVFSIDFKPNLEFIDNLLQLKGPNYNIDIKDRINNSTNFKSLDDLINTNSSQSYYQFNSLRNEKGIILRKNWGDWNQFVKYSSAEQRLDNFKDKLTSIESFEDELLGLNTITGGTPASSDYSSSYNSITNNINKIISKFDSYEYFLYYITGSESWPKRTTTYPYANYSVTSSEGLNWLGSTNENSAYYNSGKNQIYSASRYDNSNQDYLYYLIPPFITENSSNDQYIKFVNMVGQTFDEMYCYTEAVEQVRNTNSGLTGSVLPLGLADEVIESLGFDTYGNSFNSVGFNVNGIGVFPAAGSGLEYIDRYVDIASGSVINYYDQQQSTLGYVIALADPSFPYPIENSSQEIYKRIFHNMVSLVKRKGTVTGLRQLINIWGVPNTMLRISEFGGKNKDDENDYDLWMNRYSNALTTYNYKKGALLPSGSIRVPWLPLTGNYYEDSGGNPPDIAVPDCIQFRFKNERPISQEPGNADSLFTSSLLVTNNSNAVSYSNFGIVLQYSGSNSGSFSGAALPTDYQYGTMQFIISGSVAQGAKSPGYFESDPISLPFFDGGWWSVQLQRKTHVSASNQNSTNNEFELRVANNIYDGYDGNQIGFQGVSTIITVGDNGVNEAWNKFSSTLSSLSSTRGVILGGYMTFPNGSGLNNTIIGGAGGRNLGTGFSGSFQEFRYYRRAMSASSFNDYVMNPESIQGHSNSNTGKGSSYDLLSYRLPLGNELEYVEASGSAGFQTTTENTKAVGILKFGGTPSPISTFPQFGSNALGSIHPSLVDKKGTLYTSSFLYLNGYKTGSGYSIVYQGWDGTDTSAVTASYLEPNTQINYMDQPAAGIRNRIKNKIQVIDDNEYGTVLSPFRSIQQEFEQSGSYTEDLNSLEVGFSFQNEINDDIIGTFGHGVVSDAIADPRFISGSSDRYPELTRIAEDYFKKYQGVTITDPTYNGGLPTIIEKEYDYNRLIKFYETSLFKAIKNYVPARTSLSTGIIVKQHLLERNKANTAIGINFNTVVAKTPENGSTNGLSNAPQSNSNRILTGQSGFNSAIQQENLLITSSIEMYSLTGSAGGSVNKYNIITNEGQFYKSESDNLILTNGVLTALYPDLPPSSPAQNIKIFTDIDYENKVYVQSEVAFRSQLRFNGLFTGVPSSAVNIKFEATSSKRGGIFDTTFSNITVADPPGLVSDNYMEIYPDERIYWNIIASGATVTLTAYIVNFGEADGFTKPEPSSSQQVNWYIDDFTGEYKVDDHQTEFYDGEFSGSNFEVIPPQYNPYRIFADGNDITPDEAAPQPFVDFTKGGGNFNDRFDKTKNTVSLASGYATTGTFAYVTGSFFNLIIGEEYTVNFTITNLSPSPPNALDGNLISVAVAQHNTPTNWSEFTINGTNGTFGEPNLANGSYSYTFTATDNFESGVADSGGIFASLTTTGTTITITVDSITGPGPLGLGPKHFYKNDGFTIIPSQSLLFQNSPYNPIINNVSGSRKSSFYFDMDFDPVNPGSKLKEGIPSDYTLLVSASQLGWEGATPTADNLLEYAEVPDSNYTTKAIINPRYIGTTLQSADYNFYTGIPSASQLINRSPLFGATGVANLPSLLAVNRVRYIGGETGSWAGDVSYGKNAVIDKNPIYLGHFKQSFSEPSIFNTTTFILDQLIQIPFDDITGEQSPIITSSLINGNNENLIQVSSTFEPGREASVIFTNAFKQFAQYNLTLNYATIGIGSYSIFSPTSNYKTLFSNQINQLNLSITNSFYRPPFQRWFSGVSPSINIFRGSYNGLLDDIDSTDLVPNRSDLELLSPNSQSAINIFTTGSSAYAESRGLGILTLLGPTFGSLGRVNISNPAFDSLGGTNKRGISSNIVGPSFAFYNSVNINSRRGDQSYSASAIDNITSFNAVEGVVLPQLISTTGYTNDNGGDPKLEMGRTGSHWGSFAYVPQTRGLAINGDGSAPYFQQPAQVGDSTVPVIANPESNLQYYRYQMSQSKLDEYEDFDTPFEIKKGDEIRVAYRFPSQVATSSFATTDNNQNYEVINQDFTVIGYEIAPPAVVTEPFSIPGGSSFVVDIPNLITSSAPQFKGLALQIDEYYDRMKIAVQNEVCFYIMNDNPGNAIQDGCGSGSFVTNVAFNSFVVNNEGENRPTKIRLSVDKTKMRLPTSLTSRAWALGTNMSGVDDIYPIKGLISPRLYGGGGLNFQRKLYATDGEIFALALDAGFVWNRLLVFPAPKSLPKPIPSGSINAVTIRRRTDDDTRVMLSIPELSGSKGIQTPSGEGYVIPNDLTPTQQGNIQKIINKLQSENVFQQNTSNND